MGFLLLDRYILREWLKVFLMTLAAMTGLLLIGRALGDMQEFIRWKASPGDILACFALDIPASLPVVLPVALLVSVLFQLGTLHRNQEITALRAAGLSIFRITRSLWFAGAALSLLLFALNASLIPLATEAGRAIREIADFEHRERTEIEKRTAHAAAENQTDSANGAAAAANAAAAAAARPPAAAVKKETPPPAVRPAAQFYANNSERRIWSINNFDGYKGRAQGVHVHQNDAAGNPVEAWLAASAAYDPVHKFWTLRDGRHLIYSDDGRLVAEPRFTGDLPLPALTEEPRLMLAMNKKPHQLSIYQIRGVLDQVGRDTSARMVAYYVQFHSILASPFCCLIVIGLAIPFSVTGVRTNPMVGVSKSLVLFAAYYLATNISSLLGSQQHLPAALAAWLPNLLMLLLAALLCRRVN